MTKEKDIAFTIWDTGNKLSFIEYKIYNRYHICIKEWGCWTMEFPVAISCNFYTGLRNITENKLFILFCLESI